MKKKLILEISGMHCANCSRRIKEAISNMDVADLNVSYEEGRLSCVADDEKKIIEAIEKLGYTAKAVDTNVVRKKYKGIVPALIIIVAFFFIARNTVGFNRIPQLSEEASYTILFVLGIATSLHCLSMCGGIVISQSVAFSNPMKASFLYNIGRVLAYTAVGAMVGGIGSVISFSPRIKGSITIFAGVFMILMALSMMDSFAFLRRYIKLPKIFNATGIHKKKNTPFFIGLATGLMPCGPLQTMQIYALGTGSALRGAFAMFVFSLGTVPLMMGLGAISGYISSGLNKRLLKLSSVLVMILGVVMVNRGLTLQGNATITSFIDSKQTSYNAMLPEIINDFQIINTSANRQGYDPNVFIIEKGKPVNWVILGDAVDSCNNEILIPELNISQKIKEGHNIIKFTPEAEGELRFSCWMGMLGGKFIVVEDINNIPANINTVAPKPVKCCTD